MIFQYGAVCLLALVNVLPLSDLGAYRYKAECSIPTAVASAYLEAFADDGDYWFTFDVALSFNYYFNTDTTTYYTNNFNYDVTISRHYTNSNTVVVTYDMSVVSSENWYSYDLDNLTTKLSFRITEGNESCALSIYTSDDALLGFNSVAIIPSGEEFIADYGFDIYFDYSYLYNQLLVYRSYYLSEIAGYQGGYDTGYTDGYGDGLGVGYDDGLGAGYPIGYEDGFADASNQDATAAVIFTGILEVGLLPINIFLAIFNYEVFGINISGLVASLLTVAIILIIIRVILAKSGGSGGSKS